MVIVGTRPEIIKLSLVLRELDKAMDMVLVHTGQNFDYELNAIFFEQMNIRKPDYLLETAAETAAATIANVISQTDQVMEQEAPDALLLYGDTNSCLAAIAAKKRQIPIFHMEAGNRSFDNRVPEEVNRKIIDHLSDINMTITEHARRYLIAEGIKAETIIKVGSSMHEVFRCFLPHIVARDVLSDFSVEPNSYFLVSMHRQENVDDPKRLESILHALELLADQYKKPIIVSVHPRTRKKLEEMVYHPVGDIHWMRPFGFLDYNHLQMHAMCVISDSGTVTEESALLGFPAVSVRDAHERPEGMDAGTLIVSALHAERIVESVSMVMRQQMERPGARRRVSDYEEEAVSEKVARIIMSYTDYVNRTVWFK